MVRSVPPKRQEFPRDATSRNNQVIIGAFKGSDIRPRRLKDCRYNRLAIGIPKDTRTVEHVNQAMTYYGHGNSTFSLRLTLPREDAGYVYRRAALVPVSKAALRPFDGPLSHSRSPMSNAFIATGVAFFALDGGGVGALGRIRMSGRQTT